ncbi:MAG: glycine dehydrogenase (aminomethyl-transferring), partial [Gammaproteobacteria bacterium]|nr:glycine dehydrogenase (aminomethyl-transferring) [Gammaproteobacteria bacterium]
MTTSVKTLSQLANHQEFIARHIGPNAAETQAMLIELGVNSVEELIAQTVPAGIRLTTPLATGEATTEADALAYLKAAASKNKMFKSYIGMGYHPTHTPNVILRNVLENPGWYTAYTPYQPEIAQGRLEALLNFQQVSLDLTGMELASASLLDEATAAAEAMALAKRVTKNKSNSYFIADDVHPQTIDVVRTRAEMFGFETIVGKAADAVNHDVFGALIQYPSTTGEVRNDAQLIADLKAKKSIVAVVTDP